MNQEYDSSELFYRITQNDSQMIYTWIHVSKIVHAQIESVIAVTELTSGLLTEPQVITFSHVLLKYTKNHYGVKGIVHPKMN